jgi:hypothetical protein
MSARIILQFAVPTGHLSGDYALLYGNSGSGDIDYDNPLLNGRKFDLFPNGAGIYGFGDAPFGDSPFGDAFSMRTSGFGCEPFGFSPFGYGTAIIEALIVVETCGAYKFAFACFDSLGNQSEDSPEEITVEVHTAPPAPSGLKKVNYDPDADVLVLETA